MGLNTIPGVSIFCGFSTVFRGKKFFLSIPSPEIKLYQGIVAYFLHTRSCVSSQYLPFCPRGTVQRADSTGGEQGFLQMLFSFCKCCSHIGSFCGLHKRVATSACGLLKAWLFFQGIRRPEPCFFVFFRRKSLAYFLPRVLSYSWMRNRCKFFRSGRHLPRKTVSVYEHNQYLEDAS